MLKFEQNNTTISNELLSTGPGAALAGTNAHQPSTTAKPNKIEAFLSAMPDVDVAPALGFCLSKTPAFADPVFPPWAAVLF